MSGGETLTPMMKQYQGMKKSLPAGVLLFFRLGDFYELFFEDAKTAAGVLGLTLTKRNSVPMCGVPYHAAENYIAKLVQAGHRVAIGEQSGEVKPGKLVERRISQVVSAGTIDDFRLLENDRPNYLAAIAKSGRVFGLAYADLTTGEFRAAEFTDEQALLDELARIEPAETLVPDDGAGLPEVPHSQPGDGYTFLPEHARELLADHFGVHSLDGFGCGGMTAAIGAAGAILHYLRHSMHRNVDHIRVLLPYQPDSHVLIDAASQSNLELVESRSGKKHTLLAALDRTSTPMGARLLRHWLLHPLRDRETLIARQDVIAAFLAEPWLLEKTRETLAGIRDVERVLGRLSQGTGNAREMQALAQSLGPQVETLGVSAKIRADHPEVILRSRRFGDALYVFAINDRREFGSYVGQHGLVMENGLPTKARLTLAQEDAHVYDLTRGTLVIPQRAEAGRVSWPVELGPCDGRLFLILPKPLLQIRLEAPATAKPGQSATVQATLTSTEEAPVRAAVPVEVRIRDANGRPAEGSGFHTAENGVLKLTLDLAPNDDPGTWEIRVRELASGMEAVQWMALQP